MFLQVSVGLLLAFNLLEKLISVNLLVLRLDVLLPQLLLKPPVQQVELLNLSIPLLDHFGQLILSHPHLSEYLPLAPQLILSLVLVYRESAIKLVNDILLLALKL